MTKKNLKSNKQKRELAALKFNKIIQKDMEERRKVISLSSSDRNHN